MPSKPPVTQEVSLSRAHAAGEIERQRRQAWQVLERQFEELESESYRTLALIQRLRA